MDLKPEFLIPPLVDFDWPVEMLLSDDDIEEVEVDGDY